MSQVEICNKKGSRRIRFSVSLSWMTSHGQILCQNDALYLLYCLRLTMHDTCLKMIKSTLGMYLETNAYLKLSVYSWIFFHILLCCKKIELTDITFFLWKPIEWKKKFKNFSTNSSASRLCHEKVKNEKKKRSRRNRFSAIPPAKSDMENPNLRLTTDFVRDGAKLHDFIVLK